MKTKSILKIAVVAMAALGAYAFSGNNANNLYIHQDGECENITVACDLIGRHTCKVTIPQKGVFDVWLDSACKYEAKHSSQNPLDMGI